MADARRGRRRRRWAAGGRHRSRRPSPAPQFHGTDPQSSFLDRIIDLLEDPGDLAADRVFASHAPRVLDHLAGRVPELRAHIKRMRRDLHAQEPPRPRQAGLVDPAKLPPPTTR